MKYEIDVTDEDIRCGSRHRSSLCPIALAAQRVVSPMANAFCQALCWWTGQDYLEGRYRIVNLPPEASQFVRDFDHGVPVKPFKFSIEVED